MNLFKIKQDVGAFRFYLSVFIAVLVVGYAGYSIAKRELAMAQQEIERLQQSVDNLNQENLVLTRNLNIIGVDLEVSRMANENSRQLIQNEIEAQIDLRRELSFYQKVMSPELEQEGFVIETLSIENTSIPGMYRYALVLMQQEKRRNKVKGRVSGTIIGSLNGQPHRVKLSDIVTDSADKLSFNFRYFEVVRGEFRLPAGFVPELIEVESKIENSPWGKDLLRRTFAWDAPLGEAEQVFANTAIQ